MKQVLLVFLGGGVGSVLRYVVTRFFNNPTTGVPYGTFLVNIIGSFLIGVFLGLALKNEALNQSQTLLLATGFCGGFTTFSAFAYENHLFLKSGNLTLLFSYIIASIVVGLLAVFLGIYIVKQLNI
ncbi:MAG: fluoride efflux transporter CrcB [Flavobacteriaceae bacterium]